MRLRQIASRRALPCRAALYLREPILCGQAQQGDRATAAPVAAPCVRAFLLVAPFPIEIPSPEPVPEPSSWLLLSLGIAGVVMIRRKLASRA